MKHLPTALLIVSFLTHSTSFNLQAQTDPLQSTGEKASTQASRTLPRELPPEQISVRVMDVLRATADDAKRWNDAHASAEVHLRSQT